jgi:hypothetical protein
MESHGADGVDGCWRYSVSYYYGVSLTGTLMLGVPRSAKTLIVTGTSPASYHNTPRCPDTTILAKPIYSDSHGEDCPVTLASFS